MKYGTRSLVIAIVFSALLWSCSDPKADLSAKIAKSEKQLFTDSVATPDPARAKEAIDLYVRFADQFPEDTASAGYLFKAGDISSKINETHQAIMLFGRMIEKYPQHRNTPFALFLQGFIYENQVGDPARAKPYYEAFLQKYPDHPIAPDVAFSLQHLGKSPEELIREFESRAADTTAASQPLQ
jgi:outer membrane protein assembly factor BamD (BamD/ComL family)